MTSITNFKFKALDVFFIFLLLVGIFLTFAGFKASQVNACGPPCPPPVDCPGGACMPSDVACGGNCESNKICLFESGTCLGGVGGQLGWSCYCTVCVPPTYCP
jgi:hypothetical protein